MHAANIRARLPAYARPKRIVQLDELPTLQKEVQKEPKLALDGGVAFALLAVSDAVARQNDRAGNVDDFLSGFAG